MPRRALVIGGLVVLVALATWPVWRALSGPRPSAPELARPLGATECVAPADYMRASHMKLLEEWRDRVVRDGVRTYTDRNGRVVTMSLSKTCIGECHTDKTKFCDRCHDYAGVKPTCWDCHVVPPVPAPPALAALEEIPMNTSRRVFLRLAATAATAAAAGSALGCASAGGTRRRLAMAIDVRKCLDVHGCRACIDACHAAHNVPAIPDRAHEVKWVWKEPFERALAVREPGTLPVAFRGSEVLVLCNHCDNPPCARVCPTGATWRRDNGIVAMDEHRCIGCRYCVAACPYGSRSFNFVDPRPFVAHPTSDYPTRTTGVVEKCTFCEERLAVGRLPACVEACPARAMVFGDLDERGSEIRTLLNERYAVRRRPELGTRPQVFYVI